MTRMIHEGLANRQVVGGDELTGQFKFCNDLSYKHNTPSGDSWWRGSLFRLVIPVDRFKL
jgi:hypothetical protein